MISTRIFCATVFTLICLTTRAQQGSADNVSNLLKPVEVIPPPPNAASLGKFGGIDIGLSSGAMSTSVPIYEYASTNIQVPISLSYYSNGFKVDEISSRVGMGWSLNAGGVITRTIYGGIDELSTRTTPTFTTVTRSIIDNFFKSVSGSNNAGGYDSQPDRFNYNIGGISGQFILDENQHPIQLNYTNLKIEVNIGGTDWDFRITTAEGVQYLFGGDSAREVTDKNIAGSECGHDLPEYAPVAFYLKKIIHPNNDEVNLIYEAIGYNYKTAISQSAFYKLQSEFTCTDAEYRTCPDLNNYISTCVTWLRTSGVNLKEINSMSGGRLVFNYRDRLDVPNDKLLSNIQLYQPGTNTLIRNFDFEYDEISSNGFSNSFNNGDNSFKYRYFLKSYTEKSADASLAKRYEFSYNNLDELPARLTFAQDHLGNFNGKNNSSLLPKPLTLSEQQMFSYATANREPDASFGQKGLLSKIKYPTGGTDEIQYEANTVYGAAEILPPGQDFYANADSQESPYPSTAYSSTATIGYSQEALINGSCTFYGVSGEEDPIHNKATIYVYDNLNNIIFQKTLLPGEIITSQNILNLSAGKSYYIKIVASGYKVRGSASFTARIGNKTIQYQNISVSGVRVAKVITDGGNGQAITKRFFYNALSTPNQSSGIVIYQPIYNKTHTVITKCRPPNTSQGISPDCNLNTCIYLGLFSSSQTNLGSFNGQGISYSKVIEGYGDNFEDGGVEHEFTVVPDMPGESKLGDNIISAPLSNQSIINGREIYSQVFKSNGTTTIPVKRTYKHYVDDTRYGTVYHGYIINKKASPYCESSPPDQNELKCYDVMEYDILTNWSYIDTLRTQTFDNAGQNYVEGISVTQYGSLSHALPTRMSTTTSDSKETTIDRYYPEDLSLTGSDEVARQALVGKHIISPVLKESVKKNSDPVTTIEVGYDLFSGGVPLPVVKRLQLGNNPIEDRFQYLDYEGHGKLLAQSKKEDLKTSYVWDASGKYLIVQVVEADSKAIAFTSFELASPGNWTYNSSSIVSVGSITGRNCFQLSATSGISNSYLIIGSSYTISYWSKSGTYSLTGANVVSTVTGRNVNGWVYYQQALTATSSTISVSGVGLIDELRLYPKGAQMTSYTYDPLIGMTSSSDPNGEITYYEYDGLNRLKNIKDYQGNIVQNFQYNYKSSCGANCYILPMQNFHGANTPGYPVGVFNVNGVLLGNAANQSQFDSLWNNNTANQQVGTLAAGADPLHFNITLIAGQSLPGTITGLRYYQFDLAYTSLDAIRNTNGAFVDFGDGTSMKLGTHLRDVDVSLPANTTMNFFPPSDQFNAHDVPYFIHTYPNSNTKTITIYHNDESESSNLDNLGNPASSLLTVSNFRGNLPQYTNGLSGSCFQSSTAWSVANINNWNSINTITGFSLRSGDGINPPRNIGFAQDFMANNRGLLSINTTYNDPTFKISRLKSDWNTYFTQLKVLQVSDDHWNREDLTALTQLNTVVIYSSSATIPSAVIDNVINQVSAGAGQYVTNGVINIPSGGPARTSASDAALTQLKSKGWKITVANVLQ